MFHKITPKIGGTPHVWRSAYGTVQIGAQVLGPAFTGGLRSQANAELAVLEVTANRNNPNPSLGNYYAGMFNGSIDSWTLAIQGYGYNGVLASATGFSFGLYCVAGTNTSDTSAQFYGNISSPYNALRIRGDGSWASSTSTSGMTAIGTFSPVWQLANNFIGASNIGLYLGSNNYYDGADYTYQTTGSMTLYVQNNNSTIGHQFYGAASGTANTHVGAGLIECFRINIPSAAGGGAGWQTFLPNGNITTTFNNVTTNDSILNMRSNSGTRTWIQFTESGVADRWWIGIANADANLYFRTGPLASFATKVTFDVNGQIGLHGNTPPNQVTGWGTPTGAAVVANFPGATATLVQCSNVIAKLITDLKAQGFYGA